MFCLTDEGTEEILIYPNKSIIVIGHLSQLSIKIFKFTIIPINYIRIYGIEGLNEWVIFFIFHLWYLEQQCLSMLLLIYKLTTWWCLTTSIIDRYFFFYEGFGIVLSCFKLVGIAQVKEYLAFNISMKTFLTSSDQILSTLVEIER